MGFSCGLAAEVGRYGVTVNCVALGAMRTGALVEVLERDPEFEKTLAKPYSVPRIGRPTDPAPLVAFLASDFAGGSPARCIQSTAATCRLYNCLRSASAASSLRTHLARSSLLRCSVHRVVRGPYPMRLSVIDQDATGVAGRRSAALYDARGCAQSGPL